MNITDIFFYLISLFILITAVLAIHTKSLFRAAVWLLFCLIGVSAFYFWIDFNFIAAIQIVIYVGGIIVIIIFSIFLTEDIGRNMQQISNLKKIGIGASIVLCLAIIAHFLFHQNIPISNLKMDTSMQNIGFLLMDYNLPYLLPFELLSILLLAVVIACIIIVSKHKNQNQ